MSDAPSRNVTSRLRGSHELGLALAIVVVVLLTTLLDSNHSYWESPDQNAKIIARHAAMLGIFAIGSAVVIIAGGIDLSSGSMIAFGGSICATIMLWLDPEGMQAGQVGAGTIGIAIAGTIVVGLLVGTLHAWLITVIGLPPFIATLATLVGLRSLGRAIVENTTPILLNYRTTQIPISDRSFRDLGAEWYKPVILFLILTAVAWLITSRTVLGRHLYAMGGNEQAARLSGIQTDRLKWFAYCFSAVCAAIAGVLYIGNQAVADPQTLGRGYELNAIAAAVVGGCSLQGGLGTIPGTALGCLFIWTVIDGISKVIKTGADVYEGLIVGIVVVFAVAFTQLRQRGQQGKQFFAGPMGWTAIAILGLVAGTLATMMAGKTTGLAVGALVASIGVAIKFYENARARRGSASAVD